jgi:hypothetical protein
MYRKLCPQSCVMRILLCAITVELCLAVAPVSAAINSDLAFVTTALVSNTDILAFDAQEPSQEPTQGQAGSSPPESKPKSYMDIYGFAMLDMGYDIDVIDPDWYDVERPSKLPSFPGEFGKDGNTYFSVRQSRFGVKGEQYTSLGPLKYEFEFDLFGVGVDAGQTTIRPRHMYGEIGPVLAGQTNSVFMDINVFPNTLEYWGPNGMVFLRNPQLRLTAGNGAPTTFMIALEKPGASGDAGVVADRIDLSNIHARFQFPDVSAALQHSWENKSYIRVAGIFRDFKIDNVATNVTQNIEGWGFNVSSNIVIHKDVIRLQYVVGDGIQNYMNDAPVDVAPEANLGNPVLPIKGKAIPMHSWVAYLDHSWSDKWTSAIGYSELIMENTTLQTADAFREGRYASVNLLYSPFKSFLTGGEFIYGKRLDFRSGFNPNDYRIQFSFKYSFDFKVFGGKS